MAEVVAGRRGATVAYDPALLTPEVLARVVTRESGYLATVIPPGR